MMNKLYQECKTFLKNVIKQNKQKNETINQKKTKSTVKR